MVANAGLGLYLQRETAFDHGWIAVTALERME